MRNIFLLILLCLPLAAPATTLHAEARAASEQQAKREALAALADSILVDVQSESSSRVEGTGKREEELHISSRSDVPLIGVEFNEVQVGTETVCEASLESTRSLVLYTKKLNELLLEITALDQRIDKASGDDRYTLLTEEMTEIVQYEKY